MIKRKDINPGKVYENKKGLRRKVIRWKIIGGDAEGYIGDIYYVPILKDGKEGKERACWCSTFQAWAEREVEA